jgi:hypothetical protein
MRLALEIAGVLFCAAVHVPLVFFYILGSSLNGVRPVPYWAAVASGYVAMLTLALVRPGPFDRASGRQALDRWLAASLPATALTAVLIRVEWPLRFASWDAHGFGASGGEANTLFFPWLQLACWLVAGLLSRREAAL